MQLNHSSEPTSSSGNQ